MSGELDLEGLRRLERHEYALPPDFEVKSSVSVDGPTWDAILAALDERERLLRLLRAAQTLVSRGPQSAAWGPFFDLVADLSGAWKSPAEEVSRG